METDALMDGRLRRIGWAGARVGAVAITAALFWGCGGTAATNGGSGNGGPAGAGASTATPVQPAPSRSPTKKPQTPRPTPTGSQGAGSASASTTKVVFVDVGQGDATLVRSGSWSGLIDGGPEGSEAALEAALHKLGVRRLSAVVVSHMHADHTGGLPRVVAEWRPKVAYVPGAPSSALRRALSAAGTKVTRVARGVPPMRWGAATAKVLSPGRLSGDANEDSVVILLDAAGRRFLFTGDCTGPNEAAVGRICARGPPVTVLKVAHHGSRYSTSSTFLAGVRATVAVISVGPNAYGHPTGEVLARLRAAGATVYTTWTNGTVTFTVGRDGAVKRTFSGRPQPVKGVADARGGGG